MIKVSKLIELKDITKTYFLEEHSVPVLKGISLEIEQDENFRFIVGYTSGGFPYGNPWEKSDDKYNDEEDVFI